MNRPNITAEFRAKVLAAAQSAINQGYYPSIDTIIHVDPSLESSRADVFPVVQAARAKQVLAVPWGLIRGMPSRPEKVKVCRPVVPKELSVGHVSKPRDFGGVAAKVSEHVELSVTRLGVRDYRRTWIGRRCWPRKAKAVVQPQVEGVTT